MIVEGCDILLDVNQVFVRQGTLIQVQRSIHQTQTGLYIVQHPGVSNLNIATLCVTMSICQVLGEKPRSGGRGRLSVVRGERPDREAIRQCFLFSNHLLVTTRTSVVTK